MVYFVPQKSAKIKRAGYSLSSQISTHQFILYSARGRLPYLPGLNKQVVVEPK